MDRKKLVLISAIGLLLLPGCNSSMDVLVPNVAAQQLNRRLTEAQLRQLAESITVRVMLGDKGRGSGVLIRKDGRVYTVLTNAHVVTPTKPYGIRTPDGNLFPAEIVKVPQHGYDMAILQFTADADYDVAALASSPRMVSQPVFAAGFSSHARGLVFTRGRLSMFPSQALQDGYQIGYTNDVARGMSGGPMLNGDGQLIGINGMGAYPILQDVYEFADGSFPSDDLREKMNRLSWGVPIGRLAEVDPSFEVALRPPDVEPSPSPVPSRPSLTGVAAEVDEVARQITVRIEQPNDNGSGVIIAQRGKTYYVLTAEHVVKYKREYEVVAPDGKRYPVDYGKVQKLAGVDLAVLQFQSQESYPVATLASYDLQVDERRWIFLSGWPGLSPGEVRSSDPEFTAGLVFSKERGAIVAKDSLSLTEANGFELVYSNPSEGGMSGGPLLDARGRVIGIHAAAEGDGFYIMGYGLGVPVRTFLSLASRTDVRPEWLQVEKTAPSPLTKAEITAIREELFTDKKPPKSGSARAWVNYGNKLWRLFEYEEAVAAFDEAIKQRPNLEPAWYGRGLALQEQGKYQAAVVSFDKATEINPRLYEAWRKQGEALYSLQRYPDALASFDKAININPEDWVLYGWRGQILQELERYAEAVKAYSQAIDIKPYYFLYLNRGRIPMALRDYSEAIADFNKAIEIKPDYVEAYNHRGGVSFDLGDLSGAIAEFNKAIEIKPDYAESYYNRGVVRYYLGDLSGAIADYNKAIEIKPDYANAYNNRGGVRSYLGDLSGAIADYNKAIEITPDYANAYYNRGVARSELGDFSEAIVDYNKAIEITPDYADAYNNRGVVRYYLGDLLGAIADFNKAIKFKPDHAEAYYNRGQRFAQLEKTTLAIIDFNKAIEIKPDYASAYLSRGAAHFLLGNKQKASADTQKAAQLFREQEDMAGYQQAQKFLRWLQQQ